MANNKRQKLNKYRDSTLINPSTNDFSGDLLKDSNLNDYESIKRGLKKDLSLIRLNTIIPTDAVGGTFEIEMEDEKTKLIIDEWLMEIDVKSKIKQMLIDASKYGDAGLYPVIIEKSRVKEEYKLEEELGTVGEIKSVNVYHRGNISDLEKNSDILDENFNKIDFIKFKVKNGTGKEVHGSRIFHYQNIADSKDKYGTPLISTIKQQINVIKQTIEAIGINAFRSIIVHAQFDAKTLAAMKKLEETTGIKVNDQVAGKNTMVTGYGDKVTMHNASVFDTEKHYSTASQILCVAAGIPLSRWLGTQQGKLTGSKTDIFIYNARLEEYRDTVITDAYRFIIDLKLKELGKENIEYKIKPSDLNILTEEEKASTEKIKTESLKNIADVFNSVAGVNGKDIARENIVDIASTLNLSEEVLNTLGLIAGTK